MNNNVKLIPGCSIPVGWIISAALAIILVFQSCGHKAKPADDDELSLKKSKIVVDESFRPIVDEELYVFTAIYSNLHPQVTYAPENNAVNLLLNYDVQVAVLSRDLTAQEYGVLKERKITPVVQ